MKRRGFLASIAGFAALLWPALPKASPALWLSHPASAGVWDGYMLTNVGAEDVPEAALAERQVTRQEFAKLAGYVRNIPLPIGFFDVDGLDGKTYQVPVYRITKS